MDGLEIGWGWVARGGDSKKRHTNICSRWKDREIGQDISDCFVVLCKVELEGT